MESHSMDCYGCMPLNALFRECSQTRSLYLHRNVSADLTVSWQKYVEVEDHLGLDFKVSNSTFKSKFTKPSRPTRSCRRRPPHLFRSMSNRAAYLHWSTAPPWRFNTFHHLSARHHFDAFILFISTVPRGSMSAKQYQDGQRIHAKTDGQSS